MSKIPNNVIKPPPGYQYVNGNNMATIKPKQDDTKQRIEYLENKMHKVLDELRYLKMREKYRPNSKYRAKRIWMSDILTSVCDYFETTAEDINSVRRHAEIVKVRSVYINLCYDLTHASQPAIGRMCGGRDHTTIIHHVKLKKNKANCWDIRTKAGLELWQDFSKLEDKLKAEAQPDNE